VHPIGNLAAPKEFPYLVNNQRMKTAFGNSHSHTNFSSILTIISKHVTVIRAPMVLHFDPIDFVKSKKAQTRPVRQFGPIQRRFLRPKSLSGPTMNRNAKIASTTENKITMTASFHLVLSRLMAGESMTRNTIRITPDFERPFLEHASGIDVAHQSLAQFPSSMKHPALQRGNRDSHDSGGLFR
jgi:hypothetical protein